MSRQLNVLISTKSIFQAGDKYVEGIMEIAPNAQVTMIEEKDLNSGVLKEAEIVFGWPGQVACFYPAKWRERSIFRETTSKMVGTLRICRDVWIRLNTADHTHLTWPSSS